MNNYAEVWDRWKRREFARKASLPMNQVLNKKTQPNTRGYVSRLGYNTACTSYTQGIEICRWSGSSLNRSFQKKRHDELKTLHEAGKEKKKTVCSVMAADEIPKDGVTSLGQPGAGEQGNKSGVPDALRKRSVLHTLSKRTKGKVRDKITAFSRSCGPNQTFLTLTFVGEVEDKPAVCCLNKFLTVIRKHNPGFAYVWIAERQENGNIHFHCIFNIRLRVREINSLWVLQQYNSGIEHAKYSRAEIMRRFKEDTIHEILNPLDVEKIKGIYGLNYYLTKYVVKNKSKGFRCSAWRCSQVVSKLFTRTVVAVSVMRDVSSQINSRVQPKTKKRIQAKNVQGAFFNLYYIENRLYFLREMSELEQVNTWILGGMKVDALPMINDVDIGKFFNN